jgi:two-component system cell cycle sensor histidine kinase PleC
LPAFHSFIVPALVPLVGRLLFEGEVLYIAMGLMGGIYFLVLAATGLDLNRTLTRALTLQIEKSDLVDDLTEARAKAEAANVAKSAFLATVSHELRTPLNAVIGFAQLLEAEVHGPLGHDKYREYLGHMNGSGVHLLNLIDELLDLSRAEAGHLLIRDEVAVDLAAELTHCVALMTARAEHRGIRLETSLPKNLPRLRADPQRLRQIVLNVLSNAVKFTPEDGLVELSATREPSGKLVLAVRDSGIGMSEGDLAVALEFFGRADNARSRATEGTGIGLPLTALLLEMHGGELEIDSQPDGGTLVNLRFPPERVIEDAEPRPPAEAPVQEDTYGSSPAA